MMRLMLRPVLVLFVALTVVLGLVYPLITAGIGTLLFRDQVKGGLVSAGGDIVGSVLIGQSFQQPRYFWGRPSATSPTPYNAVASGGSNFGPLNPALVDAVKGRIDALRAADPHNRSSVPVDLVTASGSGLDPQISPAGALYQVERVARERHLDPVRLRQFVVAHVEPPQWGLFGEPRVNVLMLNLELDRAQ